MSQSYKDRFNDWLERNPQGKQKARTANYFGNRKGNAQGKETGVSDMNGMNASGKEKGGRRLTTDELDRYMDRERRKGTPLSDRAIYESYLAKTSWKNRKNQEYSPEEKLKRRKQYDDELIGKYEYANGGKTPLEKRTKRMYPKKYAEQVADNFFSNLKDMSRGEKKRSFNPHRHYWEDD